MENIIITIARQFGSGGKTIGEMYAAKKGINCYSREILKMASEDSGINELLFHKADERVKGNALFGMAKRIYKGDLISSRKATISSPTGTCSTTRRRSSSSWQSRSPV